MAELVLVVSPHIRSDGTKHPSAFDARLDGELICTSETPLFSAARVLLKTGRGDPTDLLVMRHAGSGHDALRARVGVAAGLTIEETGHGPRRRKYRPRPILEGPPRIEQTTPEAPPARLAPPNAPASPASLMPDECSEPTPGLAVTPGIEQTAPEAPAPLGPTNGPAGLPPPPPNRPLGVTGRVG